MGDPAPPMRDPRLTELEFLSRLEKGALTFTYFDQMPAEKCFGLHAHEFRDMLLHLLVEGHLNGAAALGRGYQISSDGVTQHLERGVANDIMCLTGGRLLSLAISYKGRLRLWSLKDELETARPLDPLTGLYTRAAFALDYEIAWAFLPNGGAVTVMAVDLDEFGSVNNTYSHSTGDEALRRFASTLKDSVGKLGSCYRFGGDEFVVLAYPMAEDVASELAESIRANVEQAFQQMQGIEKVPKRPTATIGVSVFTGRVDQQRAYEFADALERTAKKEGKNRVLLKVHHG